MALTTVIELRCVRPPIFTAIAFGWQVSNCLNYFYSSSFVRAQIILKFPASL